MLIGTQFCTAFAVGHLRCDIIGTFRRYHQRLWRQEDKALVKIWLLQQETGSNSHHRSWLVDLQPNRHSLCSRTTISGLVNFTIWLLRVPVKFWTSMHRCMTNSTTARSLALPVPTWLKEEDDSNHLYYLIGQKLTGTILDPFSFLLSD